MQHVRHVLALVPATAVPGYRHCTCTVYITATQYAVGLGASARTARDPISLLARMLGNGIENHLVLESFLG